VYRDGIEDGTFKTYYESGNLKSEYTYKSGRLNGAGKEYYESGRLKAEGESRDSCREGVWTTYYEDGKTEYIDTYNHGQKIHRKSFDQAGNLIFDQDYSYRE
jgi:antitoxin component YwqK of YwqJK toxin-antitoxin module